MRSGFWVSQNDVACSVFVLGSELYLLSLYEFLMGMRGHHVCPDQLVFLERSIVIIGKEDDIDLALVKRPVLMLLFLPFFFKHQQTAVVLLPVRKQISICRNDV